MTILKDLCDNNELCIAEIQGVRTRLDNKLLELYPNGKHEPEGLRNEIAELAKIQDILKAACFDITVARRGEKKNEPADKPINEPLLSDLVHVVKDAVINTIPELQDFAVENSYAIAKNIHDYLAGRIILRQDGSIMCRDEPTFKFKLFVHECGKISTFIFEWRDKEYVGKGWSRYIVVDRTTGKVEVHESNPKKAENTTTIKIDASAVTGEIRKVIDESKAMTVNQVLDALGTGAEGKDGDKKPYAETGWCSLSQTDWAENIENDIQRLKEWIKADNESRDTRIGQLEEKTRNIPYNYLTEERVRCIVIGMMGEIQEHLAAHIEHSARSKLANALSKFWKGKNTK